MFKHLQRGRSVKVRSQSGAALILIMFILGLAIAAYTIKAFTAASMQARQDEETMKTLGEAKAALIAWAVSNPNPGQMPFPDRATDGDYDGFSDCFSKNLTTFKYKFLLGQLPIYGQTSPCVLPWNGLGGNWLDSQNNRLWYAVSRNLVHDYELLSNDPTSEPVINPGMINGPYSNPPYLRQGHTTAYPWFQVYDANGVLLSDRVAAVIIAPGSPINNQNRSATADPDQFLDQVVMSDGITYKNYGFPIDDSDIQKFIVGQNGKTVSDTDLRYQHPYHFNDKLVYITIDELMAALEKRVANEARNALKQYQVDYGVFPYAAPLGSINSYSCIDNTTSGLLPLDANPSTACTCASSNSCTCSFNDIDNVIFTRNNLSWNSSTPGCTYSGGVCTCASAGKCEILLGPIPLAEFSCDGNGVCNTSGLISSSGSFNFTGTFSRTNVNTTTGACTHSCGTNTVSCNGTGSFSSGSCADPGLSPTVSVTLGGTNQLTTTSNFITQGVIAGMNASGVGIPDGTIVNSVTNTSVIISQDATSTGPADITFSRFPSWFEANDWQDYIYYTISRGAASPMTVGTKTGVTALLATTGRAIDNAPFAEMKAALQSRVSCDVVDYLDSSSNADGDEIYDATNKPRTLNYNDQLFIVAP